MDLLLNLLLVLHDGIQHLLGILFGHILLLLRLLLLLLLLFLLLLFLLVLLLLLLLFLLLLLLLLVLVLLLLLLLLLALLHGQGQVVAGLVVSRIVPQGTLVCLDTGIQLLAALQQHAHVVVNLGQFHLVFVGHSNVAPARGNQGGGSLILLHGLLGLLLG